MALQIKPSWLIIGSLIFGYISIWLPGIQVQYQIVDSQSNSIVSLSTEEKLISLWSDASRIPPCDLGNVQWDSELLRIMFLVCFSIGFGIQVINFQFWVTYAVRNNIGKGKFFLILAGLVLLPLFLFIIMNPFRNANLCNPSYVFRVVSFLPYFPTWILLITSLAFGYLASKAHVSKKGADLQ